MRIPYISLLAAGALALGGCAYGDYGMGGSPYYSSSYGYGYDSGYGYSPYYGSAYGGTYGSAYGYNPYYGSAYGYSPYGYRRSGPTFSIGIGTGYSRYGGYGYPGYGYYSFPR